MMTMMMFADKGSTKMSQQAVEKPSQTTHPFQDETVSFVSRIPYLNSPDKADFSLRNGPKKRCRALTALIENIRLIRYGKTDRNVGRQVKAWEKFQDTQARVQVNERASVPQNVTTTNLYYPHDWAGAVSLDEVVHKYEPDCNRIAFKQKLGLPSTMRLSNVLDPCSLPEPVSHSGVSPPTIPCFDIPAAWLPPSHTPLVPEDCSALDIERKPTLPKKRPKRTLGTGKTSSKEEEEMASQSQDSQMTDSQCILVDDVNSDVDMRNDENLNFLGYDEYEHAQFDETPDNSQTTPNQYWLRGGSLEAHTPETDVITDSQSDSENDDAGSLADASSEDESAATSSGDPMNCSMPTRVTRYQTELKSPLKGQAFKRPYNTRHSTVKCSNTSPEELPDLYHVQGFKGNAVDASEDRQHSKRLKKELDDMSLPEPTAANVNNNAIVPNYGFDDLLISSSSSETQFPEFSC